MRFSIGILVLTASAFGSSIVTNGDFGTGDLTGWTINGSVNVDDVWDVHSSDDAVGGAPAPFYVSEGCNQGVSECINNVHPNFLLQDLSTNPGDTYTLSFDYDPDAEEDVARGFAELQVRWLGMDVTIPIDLVLGAVLTGGQTTPLTGFNTYTVSGLVATSQSTTLAFVGEQDPSFDGLTNISVVDNSAAPEPGSYLLAAAGLLALGVAKWRAARA